MKTNNIMVSRPIHPANRWPPTGLNTRLQPNSRHHDACARQPLFPLPLVGYPADRATRFGLGQSSLPVIKSTKLSGNTLTIQTENFPSGPLSVKFNGTAVPSTYDQPAQQLSATLASVPAAGTYLLVISKSGISFAFVDVTIARWGCKGRLAQQARKASQAIPALLERKGRLA